jgi:hypothetical protein
MGMDHVILTTGKLTGIIAATLMEEATDKITEILPRVINPLLGLTITTNTQPPFKKLHRLLRRHLLPLPLPLFPLLRPLLHFLRQLQLLQPLHLSLIRTRQANTITQKGPPEIKKMEGEEGEEGWRDECLITSISKTSTINTALRTGSSLTLHETHTQITPHSSQTLPALTRLTFPLPHHLLRLQLLPLLQLPHHHLRFLYLRFPNPSHEEHLGNMHLLLLQKLEKQIFIKFLKKKKCNSQMNICKYSLLPRINFFMGWKPFIFVYIIITWEQSKFIGHLHDLAGNADCLSGLNSIAK